MRIHLDPVGGISGDMFVGALLDAWPELTSETIAAVQAMGLPDSITPVVAEYRDNILTGTRFQVAVSSGDHSHIRAHTHVHWCEIRERLTQSALPSGVIERAIDIFGHLAEAEGKVHGIPADEVAFHEVGAWDSIADIIAAAFLIDVLKVRGWSISTLPVGSGRVCCAHGELPVPAPAVVLLLEGFILQDDGVEGERVTPTGAAILRHLNPSYRPPNRPVRLARSGNGFGQRKYARISNVLRVLVLEDMHAGYGKNEIAVIHFEVDDQPAEDLAIGLEYIRKVPGVFDVLQVPTFGKKGRIGTQLQILARPDALDRAIEACFTETTTLGLRWNVVQKAVLERYCDAFDSENHRIQVKVARRPSGVLTGKAEINDVAATTGGFVERARLRRKAEQGVLSRGLKDE